MSYIETPYLRIREEKPGVYTVYKLDVAPPELPAIVPPTDLINELPWNDASPWPFVPRSLESIEIITIHHSGSTDREHTSIENWNSYHTRTKRWPHIGYHLAVGFYGGVMGLYQLNRLDMITWHDSKNTKSIGVVIAGDLRAGEDGAPTDEQARLFGRLMVWLVPQLPSLRYIVGHKHRQSTACPGQIEVYGSALIQAARDQGQEIAHLWMKPLPARARVFGLLQRRIGPPRALYEDV